MKTIRFKNDWRYSRKDDVIEEGDGVALLLIQRGIAEEVDPEEVNVETTETNETAETEESETEESETGEQADSAGSEAALPDVITRRVPGPNEAARRRGGRG